ncbi:DUF423 domain-containing protein [Bizionia argentinensis JUB59]|uniref:DUF423 domain-containing protein n=1 Tax=Bizionia argentinensis JUB59 TaxID=1046627 RepID=G2EHF9_9FLAO|nr:DUF423 domain-containing protein [Bizionia argentinensis]EGV42146.1 DUF423 domain-containing protein [Bizionia argentinensis JUB59]
MDKKMLILGSFLGLTAVILGAFGAHGLKALILPEQITTFETGVRYQMYHALFLLVVGSLSSIDEKTKKVVFYLVLGGVLLFSGSIYGLATNNLTGFNFKSVGFITPIGGLLLIISWFLLLLKFLKNKPEIS